MEYGHGGTNLAAHGNSHTMSLTLDEPGQMHVEMSASSGVSCTSEQILLVGGSEDHTWSDRGDRWTCQITKFMLAGQG